MFNRNVTGIIRSTLDGEILDCNNAFATMLGYEKRENILELSAYNLHYSKESRDAYKKDLLKENSLVNYELCLKSKTGKEVYVLVNEYLIENEKNEESYSDIIAINITELKEAREKLGSIEKEKSEALIKEKENYINYILKSSLDVIVVADENGIIKEFNEAGELLFGYKKEEVIGEKSNILHVSNENQTEVFDAIKATGMFAGEILNKKKNGEVFTSYLSASILKNKEGKKVGVVGISRDISRQTDIKNKLKDSLHEKEILLKEVHHRVKNNMQVISSILNLQSSFVSDKNTLEILKESQNRIKSMSFIHESLYQTKDMSSINLSDYIVNLSNNLLYSYKTNRSLVDFKLDIENINIGLDQAIPCGLILNELVSNALKYAFPNEQKGKLSIEVKEEDNELFLRVEDNGVGFEKEFNYENANSLGLQLVHTLVEQLDGTIKVETEKGTRYLIRFVNKN